MKEKVLLSYGKGITHSPSDLLCGDGELEECVNLEVKEGELVPMEMPVMLPFSLEEGEYLLLVHNTKSADKHYITIKDSVLGAFRVENDVRVDMGFTCTISGSVSSIQSIGNTVILYGESDVYYILYKEGAYTLLGDGIPELDISFELKAEAVVSEEFDVLTPNMANTDDEYQKDVCEQIAAKVAKFVAEEGTGKNRFVYPFFVRYALRLFDGTHIRQSAPILMYPNSSYAPYAFRIEQARQNYLPDYTYRSQLGMFVSQLRATIHNGYSFLGWEDIVTGVDVFVSRQISGYDAENVKFGSDTPYNYFIGEFNSTLAGTVWETIEHLDSVLTISPSSNQYIAAYNVGQRDAQTFNDEIVNTSLFYKFSFIDINDIKSSKQKYVEGELSNLEVNEHMSDDYMTHDKIIADLSFVYNGRLNISQVERTMYKGFPLQSLMQLVKRTPEDVVPGKSSLEFNKYYIYTYIKKSDGGNTAIVKSNLSIEGAPYGGFVFYPDPDAYKMIIVNERNDRYVQINLSEHPLLNGAYAYINIGTLNFVKSGIDITEGNYTEKMYNKLIVSEVNNPFYFPLEGYYTVGSDKIIGISAVTRPISQGQFGEFPLIVFCSDGNYAMRVDEQGYYSSISPIQEDVVLGSDKIAAMENSVVVITKRGLMLTTGGEMQKIASQMDGGVVDLGSLEGVSTSVSAFADIVSKAKDSEGFLSYVYGSRMAFDYASNRLFVYNTNKTYSYVYKFENDTVSKLSLNGGKRIVTSVMDYPDTILQDESGNLYSLYQKEDVSALSEHRYGLALTRPLKMGTALSLKSIRQVMHLTSNCGNGSYVKYILYGSNDNVNYYKVSSRFGKPYKYYRVAIYTNLLPKESLSGSALTIEERRTHKLR